VKRPRDGVLAESDASDSRTADAGRGRGADAPDTARRSSPPPRRGSEEARRAELDAATAKIAEAWALRAQRDLKAQGREVAGGWPGTMTEARAVTLAYFASAAGASLAPLTREELEHAARSANARARAVWRAVAVSDDGEAI
jgi:hypothetical protein